MSGESGAFCNVIEVLGKGRQSTTNGLVGNGRQLANFLLAPSTLGSQLSLISLDSGQE